MHIAAASSVFGRVRGAVITPGKNKKERGEGCNVRTMEVGKRKNPKILVVVRKHTHTHTHKLP